MSGSILRLTLRKQFFFLNKYIIESRNLFQTQMFYRFKCIYYGIYIISIGINSDAINDIVHTLKSIEYIYFWTKFIDSMVHFLEIVEFFSQCTFYTDRDSSKKSVIRVPFFTNLKFFIFSCFLNYLFEICSFQNAEFWTLHFQMIQFFNFKFFVENCSILKSLSFSII